MFGTATRKYGAIGIGAVCVLCILVFASCNFSGNDAEAADEDNISETFLIDPGSFQIATDQGQDIEIFDGATKYTMRSDGTLSFTLEDGEAVNRNLDSGDVVIERPSVGAVTFIHDVD